LAHVLVRSLRFEAALRNEIPIEQLRPLACLHVARAFARDIVDGLASCSRTAFADLLVHMTPTLLAIAREQKPSRWRTRISLILGAVGAEAIGDALQPAHTTPPFHQTYQTANFRSPVE